MSKKRDDSHEDLTSPAYYSYVISLLKREKFGRNLLEKKGTKQWPRVGSYETFINNIVSVGLKAPIKSIRTMFVIVFNYDSNDDLKNIFGANDDNEKLKYSMLLLYFIFADSVVQLMSYVDNKNNNNNNNNNDNDNINKNKSNIFDEGQNNLQDPLLKICEACLNFKDKDPVFISYLNTVIKQFSVIYYKLHSSFEECITYLQSLLGQAKHSSTKEFSSYENLFIIHRFAQPTEDNPFGFINLVLEKKKEINNEVAFFECIKSGLYQLPPKNYSTNELKRPLIDILNKNFEFKALFMSRNTSITFSDIAKFMKDNKEKNSENYLRGFLYLLRKPEFRPLNEIWEYGERNDYFYLFQEKDNCSSYEGGDFVDIFFEYVASKVEDNELSTKIILNLLSRDLDQNIEKFIKQIPKNRKIIGPFFNALTIIFNRKSKFFDNGASLNENSKENLSKFIQKNFEQDNTEFTTIPSFCRSVTFQSCKDLTPDQDVMPQVSKNDFVQRIEKAKSLTDDILVSNENENPDEFFAGEQTHFRSFFITSKYAEWQKKIYIITIIYNIEKKPTDDFFNYLVNMTLNKVRVDEKSLDCTNIAYFALYALQVFYIRKQKTAFSILNAINKVMKERTIGKKIAFTLLNLLNQLFSLPIFSVNFEEDSELEWLDKWSSETQAILLAHLLSPYVHVRDMTLIVMERLNEILKSYDIKTNITSLMHEYDSIMMQRVEQRLRVSGNSSQSLEKLNFSTILRSPNYFLVIYALVEYAQVLSREEMSDVLKEFFQLEALKSINKKGLTLDQLPFISFVQRICPMSSESKEIINQNFFDFPGIHSLKAYKIFDKEFSLDEEAQELINNFTSLFSKDSITKECKKLKNSQRDYNILAALANSLSIELMPNFIQGFVNYLDKSNSLLNQNTILEAKRIGKIICCILLSSDFNLFAFVHMKNVSVLYQSFSNWYLTIFRIIADLKDDLEFMLCFCSSILSLSQSLVQYGKKAELPWNIQVRQQIFKFLLEEHENPVNKDMVERTILTLLDSVSIFDSNYPLDLPIYRSLINIETSNPNARPLRSILIHHPDMFNDYFSRCINYSVQYGFYYYRAISEFFVYNFRNFKQSDLNDNVKIVIDNTGKLILSGLVFIASSHSDFRKSAFSLLKCVLPIICAFYDKENIQHSANINTYLNQHQNELNNYSITPSNQQVYELAEYISENMTFVVSKVFESFFELFSQNENFSDFILVNDGIECSNSNDTTAITKISPNYFTNILNAVSPFARYLTFAKGVSVYPSNSNQSTTMRGIDFINNLINIYPHLSKSNIPFYARIFNEACNTNENTRTLARLLIMNSNSLRIASNDNILNTTTTILLYLIQNSNPTEFLSLLLQRLSFGYWFTNKYGSTDLLTEKPYKLLDWFVLTMNILHDIAIADFSRLYPYVHQILHFCLMFNNIDQNYNNKISSLLQIVCNNIDISIPVSENMIIGYYENTNQLSISSIIKKISSPLKKLLPKSIKDWKDHALQWAANCGDLILAGRSAVIYSCLEETPSEKDNDIIVNSLLVVFRETEVTYSNTEENVKLIFYYLRGILKMMLSNVQYSIDNKMEESLTEFLYYSMAVISIADKDEESTKTSLEIIDKILRNNQTRINNYEEFSKLIAISFNEPLILRILNTLFISRVLPNKNKVIVLGFLLLYCFASVSAYQSASPFNTFVSEVVFGYLFKKITLFREQKNKYGELFAKYFLHDENTKDIKYVDKELPIRFIEEVVNEIWNSPEDSTFIADIIYTYTTILNTTYKNSCKSGNVIRDIVFIVVNTFIEKCPTNKKDQIPTLFDNIVSYAILEDTEASRILLASQMNASIFGELHSNKLPKPITEPTKPKIIDSGTAFVYFMTNILNLRRYYPRKYSNVIDFKACTPKNILMLCTQYTKHDMNMIKALFNKKFEPFDEQTIFWNEIENEKLTDEDRSGATEIGENEPFDFFAHSQAKNAVQKTSEEQYASKVFDPKSFILRDEDFESYDRRLNKKTKKENK